MSDHANTSKADTTHSSNGLPTSITDLIAALREFAPERDWEQFHTP